MCMITIVFFAFAPLFESLFYSLLYKQTVKWFCCLPPVPLPRLDHRPQDGPQGEEQREAQVLEEVHQGSTKQKKQESE